MLVEFKKKQNSNFISYGRKRINSINHHKKHKKAYPNKHNKLLNNHAKSSLVTLAMCLAVAITLTTVIEKI